MKKTIVVDTDREKGQLFSVSESSGKFYVYKGSGWGKNEIGQARSLDDAIVIIKSRAKGTVKNVEIR